MVEKKTKEYSWPLNKAEVRSADPLCHPKSPYRHVFCDLLQIMWNSNFSAHRESYGNICIVSVDAFALEWQSWVAPAEAVACKTWIIYGRACYRVWWSHASGLWKNMLAFIRPSYLTLRHLLAGALSEVRIFLSLLSVDWRKPALKGRGTLFASISALTHSSSQLRQLQKLNRL